MARITDQVRAGDVSFWGVFALVTWGLAVGSASVSAIVPGGVIGWLHASRADGGNLGQLKAVTDDMREQVVFLSQKATALEERFSLSERNAQEMLRRVGALEVSVPQLVEAVNAGPAVDDTAVTAAIPQPGATTTRDVPGGSVAISTGPMTTTVPTIAVRVPDAASTQTMPAPLTAMVTPDPDAFGVVLGPPIDAQDGKAAWDAMRTKVGTLLVGLSPVLARVEGGPGRKLVAGPLATDADAQEICGRMARVGVACSVAAYMGDPLTLSDAASPSPY